MNFSLMSIAAKGAIYADCETTRLHNSATGSRAESSLLLKKKSFALKLHMQRA